MHALPEDSERKMPGAEILLVSVLVVLVQGTNSSLSPNWQTSWIEGGSNAAPGEFPFMVSVRNCRSANCEYCGGSIINTWYVLTAAHCVTGAKISKVKVAVGTNELYRGGQTLAVTRIIRHHSFDPKRSDNDIALLRVRTALMYSATVQPVRLPNQDENTNPKTECIIMGWGYTSATARSLPNNLQKLQLRTISNDDCDRYYLYISDTKICANAGPRRGPCGGDSGGPLVCDGKQIGVMSGRKKLPRNVECDRPWPSVFIYVPKYIDWIRSHAV